MNNLKIEKKPFNKTLFFGGTYTTEEQWEDEYESQSYDFTVVVTHDIENDLKSIEEIIWTEGAPRNVDQVDDYINENFFEITEL